MGRFQQLRAKALSLRGAIAVGGALVMAASMAQVSGTLAQSEEVREAKAGIATQNYFPTPLVSSISCSHSGTVGFRQANVSWTAPSTVDAPTGYRYRVSRIRDNGNLIDQYDTGATSTGNFRIGGTIRTEYLYVQTINPDNGAVISSGSRSFEIYSGGVLDTYCRGSARLDENQPWENTYTYSSSMGPFAAGPGAQVFPTLMDTLNSEETLGPLPEEAELADLGAAAKSDPAAKDEMKSTESGASTTAPVPTPSSDEVESQTEDGSREASASSPSTSTALSTPATLGTAKSVARATSPQAVPTTTTTAITVRAGVGDDPIVVGTSQARLEEAGGQTQLIVTGNGSEMCTAEVDGASRIESSEGALTATVSGRTKSVDLETCELT